MGQPKGLLLNEDGETILARLLSETRLALPTSEVVLVGAQAEYAGFGVEQLQDEAPAVGPLAGLASLLAQAQARGRKRALALSCDLPYLEAELIARLAEDASERVVAPQMDGFFQPFFASYPASLLEVVRAQMRTGRHSLQPLLKGAEQLELSEEEKKQLRDWDQPADLPASLRGQLER